MTEIFRDCPDCEVAQVFCQAHPEPEPCPDFPDGHCAEWYCATCGTMLLAGAPPLDRAA